MPTIYDIARQTGYSPSTVSRALQESRMVGDEVKARVRVAAEQLGYKRRPVRRPRTRAILNVRLVLPRPSNPARGLFYDFAELLAGLHEGFAGSAINLTCDLATPDYEPFPHKKGGDTDAFVFAFHQPAPDTLRALESAKTPFVVLNRTLPGLPCIGTDHLAGMRALVAHLLAGYPDLRPVFVGLERMGEVAEERRDAFFEACKESGIAMTPESAVLFPTLDSITGDAVTRLAGRANALVAVNDIVGLILLEELRGHGVDVPGTVAVTGYDDSPLRRISRPLLTTFSLPVHAIGARAGHRLLKEILGKESPSPSERVAGKLLPGQSTRVVPT